VISGGQLMLGADNQIADNVYIQVAAGGTFNLNGHTDTIYNLNNLGGTVTTGARGAALHLIDPTWNAGSNNIVSGGTTYDVIAQDTSAPANLLVIAGAGNNVVHGSETYGVGADGANNGLLIIGGPTQITGTGNVLTVNSDHQQGGAVWVKGDVSATFASGTASITNGAALLSDGITVDPDQTNLVNGTLNLQGGTRNFTVTNAAATLSIAPTITNGGINVNSPLAPAGSGAGTLLLTGNNTFTGATTVSGGTLTAAGTGTNKALGGTSSITVNTGGTLMMAANNQINSTAGVTLNGGTFNLGGFSQGSAGVAGAGSLTLSANSTLDYGPMGSSNVIEFGGLGSHVAGSMLNITDYDPGIDHLYFVGNSATFTSEFAQNEVSFNGAQGYGAISFGSYYEIVAVPEPAETALIGSLALCGLVGFRERRRLQALWRKHFAAGIRGAGINS